MTHNFTKEEYSVLLRETYAEAKNAHNPEMMLKVIELASSRSISILAPERLIKITAAKKVLASIDELNLDKAPKPTAPPELVEKFDIEARNEYKHPNPFDSDIVMQKQKQTIDFAAAVKAGLPHQKKVIKDVPDTFPVEGSTTRYYHKWSEADEKAIYSFMNKPKTHSHRVYEYVKQTMDHRISDSAFRAKLRLMGISLKKGRLIWKKHYRQN